MDSEIGLPGKGRTEISRLTRICAPKKWRWVITENEFIGEDAGPIEHPMDAGSDAKLAAFVFETQSQLGVSDRILLDR